MATCFADSKLNLSIEVVTISVGILSGNQEGVRCTSGAPYVGANMFPTARRGMDGIGFRFDIRMSSNIRT